MANNSKISIKEIAKGAVYLVDARQILYGDLSAATNLLGLSDPTLEVLSTEIDFAPKDDLYETETTDFKVRFKVVMPFTPFGISCLECKCLLDGIVISEVRMTLDTFTKPGEQSYDIWFTIRAVMSQSEAKRKISIMARLAYRKNTSTTIGYIWDTLVGNPGSAFMNGLSVDFTPWTSPISGVVVIKPAIAYEPSDKILAVPHNSRKLLVWYAVNYAREQRGGLPIKVYGEIDGNPIYGIDVSPTKTAKPSQAELIRVERDHYDEIDHEVVVDLENSELCMYFMEFFADGKNFSNGRIVYEEVLVYCPGNKNPEKVGKEKLKSPKTKKARKQSTELEFKNTHNSNNLDETRIIVNEIKRKRKDG